MRTAIQYHRHQRVAPFFSVSGSSTRRFRHSVSQASTSGTEPQEVSFIDSTPPFSITGINEWHRKKATSRQRPRCSRHSVSQASTSGTSVPVLFTSKSYHRHSVSQASTSGTTRNEWAFRDRYCPAIQYHRHQRVAQPRRRSWTVSSWTRHSVSQASTSGTSPRRGGS